MALQARSILGVDINPNEICVVEMRGAWPNGQVLRADAAPTPTGAVEEGRIRDPEVVAEVLRDLLERMGVGTRDAVFGIAARNVIARVIEVPRVPDSELPVVIEGELTHYQVLGSQKNALDFIRLHEDPDNSGTIPQVLVMATEEQVVKGYCAAADLAGLRLVALDSTLSAMYRAAFLQLQAHPAAVCLAISHTEAEIAVVDQGQIRLYRRVDTGSNHLIASRASGFEKHRDVAVNTRQAFNIGDVEEEPSAWHKPELSGQIDPQAADSLGFELRRSLDYYQSQFPQSNPVQHVVLAIDDPALEPLASWLAHSLGLEVGIARLPVVWAASRGLAARLEPPGDLQFISASGLAMHELANPPATLPRMDLSTRQRASHTVEFARRRLVLSLALSSLTLVVSIGLAFCIGRNASDVNVAVDRARADLNRIQQVKQTSIDAIQTQANLLRALRTQGFPFPRIMDAVTRSIAPQAGFTEISLNQEGRLVLTGEAANEEAVIKTLEGFKSSPYFEESSLESFGKSASSLDQAPLVKFVIDSQLAGARHPAAAKTP